MSLLTDLLMAKVPGSSSKSKSAESIQGRVEFTQTFENVLNGTLEESVNADGSSPISEVPLSAGEHPLPINATTAPADSDTQGATDDVKASIHNTVSGETMDSSIPAGTPAGSVVDSANQPSGSTGSTSNTATSDLVNWPGVASSTGMTIDSTMQRTGVSATDQMASVSLTSNVPQGVEGQVVPTSPSTNGMTIDAMTLQTGVSATDQMASVSLTSNVPQGVEGQVVPTSPSTNGMTIDAMTLQTGASATDLMASVPVTSKVAQGPEDAVLPASLNATSDNGTRPSNGGVIDPIRLPTGTSSTDLLAATTVTGRISQDIESNATSTSSSVKVTRVSVSSALENSAYEAIAARSVKQSLGVSPPDVSQAEVMATDRAETPANLAVNTRPVSPNPLPNAISGGESANRDALTMAMLTAGNSARVQGSEQAARGQKSASAFIKTAASESAPLQTQNVDFDAPMGKMPSPEVATPRNAVAAAELTVGPVPTTGAATSAAVSSSSSLLVNDVAPREQHQFANDMATHVRVLKGQGGGEAKLNLHPMELGRMSITVATEGSETKVMFVVETAQARQSVEAAMPRLREMLDQAGLSLTDSDVAERKDQSQSGDRETWSSEKKAGFATNQDADTEVLQISVSMDSERLLDTFA